MTFKITSTDFLIIEPALIGPIQESNGIYKQYVPVLNVDGTTS